MQERGASVIFLFLDESDGLIWDHLVIYCAIHIQSVCFLKQT